MAAVKKIYKPEKLQMSRSNLIGTDPFTIRNARTEVLLLLYPSLLFITMSVSFVYDTIISQNKTR